MQEKQTNENKYFIKYSDVETKQIDWLWFPYLPKGMVSIIQGDPKCGKTFMLIDIISRITRGDYKPLSDEKFDVGNVIFQNSDDPIEYSLKGRFEQQKADTTRVFCVDEKQEKLYFNNLEKLKKLIEEQKPVLVVIDPIQAYMGDGDSNSMVQVRNALAPLKTLAEQYNVAIVLVQHLKKGNETKAIYKGAGSIDFVGFARSMVMIVKDTENDERLLIHTTSNVAKEGHCLSYRITNDGLEWLEDKGEVNVNEVANQDSNTKFENAKNFILGCIASKGDISATELQQLCNIGGFSERTFNGARSYLNKNNKIHSIKKNGRTYWSLSCPLDDNVQSCNVESEALEDDKI